MFSEETRLAVARPSIQNFDAPLRAVRPNVGNVHRMAQDRQSVKRARTFSPHFVRDLPNTLRQVIDEQSYLAIAQFLINPLLAPGKTRVRREIHECGVLALQGAGLELFGKDVLTTPQLYGFQP